MEYESSHTAKTKRKSAESIARPAPPGEASAAFTRVRDTILAVPDEQLVAINVDIPRAVSIVMGAIPAITEMMPELDQLLQLKHAKLTELRDYAFAAWFAHLAAAPTETEEGKQALLDEAGPLRNDLLVAAEALAYKQQLDPVTVADIRAGGGNLDRANDLMVLAALFTSAWERVQNKTTVTWQDVEKAAELGPRLFAALAARSVSGSDAASGRARAFTLLVRTYEQARRGVTFLRWDEDDADVIVPSIYGGRQRRRASADKPNAPSAAPPAEAQPSA